MLELINEIMTAPNGNQLGQLFYLGGMLSFMFFIPYPMFVLTESHRTRGEVIGDAAIGVCFIGLWVLGYHTAGFEGVVAFGVGVALALGTYVMLLSPVILIMVTSDFILPAVRSRTA